MNEIAECTFCRFLSRLMVLMLTAILLGPSLAATPAATDADGSFLMETGEVITGGYFVEAGEGRFLFMDTERLKRGGLFERADEDLLRSIVPPRIEIDLLRDRSGAVNELVWREGKSSVRATRVHPHDTRPVVFESAHGTLLQGRLLLPRCDGPHPLVVSVHGSGPVDRHGGPYQTVWLQSGIAVLSYDKRGYSSPGPWREPDYATLSEDAAAAVRFAGALPEIDVERIGFVGSSQAGWVVPRAAVDSGNVSFMILRAGAGLSAGETVLHEIHQELRAAGLGGIDLDHAMALRREIYELAMSGLPLSATDRVVEPYLGEEWYEVAFGTGRISERWSEGSWSWMQRNLEVSPESYVERFEGPVLWFLAEKDENVPLVPTRAALERAFAASPGRDQTVVVLEDALHSFLIPDEEGGPPRFSPGFFDFMKKWVEERGLAGEGCPREN